MTDSSSNTAASSATLAATSAPSKTLRFRDWYILEASNSGGRLSTNSTKQLLAQMDKLTLQIQKNRSPRIRDRLIARQNRLLALLLTLSPSEPGPNTKIR